MGWIGTKQTRAQAVREIVASHENATCLAFEETKRGVWSVWQMTGRRDPARKGDRIICYSLIESRDGYQMVKDLDETMGPVDTDCPLAFLDMATTFAQEAFSPAWRERVREAHGEGSGSRARAQERLWASGANVPADGLEGL